MAALQSGLPELVADDETLARFLTQSSHLNTTMVKPSALLPSQKDHESSVSRHGREPQAELWGIGFAAANGRSLYGAAIFKAATVRRALLDVIAAEPPPRHAAIRGWPLFETDPIEQKAKWKLAAAVIASESDLCLRQQ